MCTHLDRTGSTYYFRRPVPKDLLGFFTTKTGKARTEWKFSLGTKDREEAKRLLRPHVSDTDKLIDEARATLKRRRTAAQSISSPEADEMDLRSREDARLASEDALEAQREADDSPVAQARYNLNREARLMREARENIELLATIKREARPQVSLLDLFERWGALPGRHKQVVKRWRVYVEALTTFLKHSDANRLTRADLIRWRNYLRDDVVYRGERLSAKTINCSYLAAVNAVLSYAVGDGLLDSNPMDGVTKVNAPKGIQLRERDLTKDEALIILRAASANTEADRRWLPWLMAYTGTRVGEPAQLRKEDVLTVDGIPVLRLTPDAGPIKNRKARLVPIHSHLIEMGFLRFVEEHEPGRLFGDDPAKVGRRVGDWVRSLKGVTVPQPNHCWRHTFKTAARASDIPEYIADRIQGHAPRHEGGKYGLTPLATLREAIERIPRYHLAKDI